MADTAALFSRVLQAADAPPGADAGGDGSADASAAGGAVGGFLVCLDVPQLTEFGVDYEVFRTGPKFQGVKFLPLGVHLVVFRAKEQEHGVRQGFFLRVERHAQVIVREWSADKEELAPPRPGLHLEALERAVLAFQLDDRLGAYPKQHAKLWQRLSSAISDSVLRRCGVEFGALILPGDSDPLSTVEPAGGEVVPFFPDLPRTAKFTDLRRRRADLSGSDRTAYHFDCSEMLEELVAAEFGGDWRELLGELQLAFVLFLQLSSLAALEQWKQFVALLCSCERALASQAELMAAFLKTFRAQMEQIPPDFFEDEMTTDNFLRPCIASLLELLDEAAMSAPVRQQGARVRDLLQRRFGWDADAELDEFAPVVVPFEESAPARPQLALTEPEAASISAADEEDRRNARVAAAFLQHRGLS